MTGNPYGDVLVDSHHRGAEMPFINVKIVEGVFTPRSVTSCVVEEVRSGDWGIGGQPMTTEDVLTVARGKAVA